MNAIIPTHLQVAPNATHTTVTTQLLKLQVGTVTNLYTCTSSRALIKVQSSISPSPIILTYNVTVTDEVLPTTSSRVRLTDMPIYIRVPNSATVYMKASIDTDLSITVIEETS